jgi:hypothetical protein
MDSKEVTQAQIDEWKAKYGSVFCIEVDGKKVYLKKPDRKVLSAAAVTGKSDPMKYNEILLTNCWLGGDDEIKTNDELFLGVCGQLSGIIEIKEAELKKL